MTLCVVEYCSNSQVPCSYNLFFSVVLAIGAVYVVYCKLCLVLHHCCCLHCWFFYYLSILFVIAYLFLMYYFRVPFNISLFTVIVSNQYCLLLLFLRLAVLFIVFY